MYHDRPRHIFIHIQSWTHKLWCLWEGCVHIVIRYPFYKHNGVPWCITYVCIYGWFLKWWYPQNTPKWSFLVGKPMVVGYHHFRTPPYIVILLFVFSYMYYINPSPGWFRGCASKPLLYPPRQYCHRIGRTGRDGELGASFSGVAFRRSCLFLEWIRYMA